MWQGQTLAIVIPAYNEARHIAAVVKKQVPEADFIIVVDDASQDKTAQIAADLGLPILHVIRHAQRQGVGAATVSGYRAALRLGADLIIGTNGDGQMNPDDSYDLLQTLDAGADLVRGDRFARSETLGAMPASRRIAVRALSSLTRLATGVQAVHDSQCGYHALRRQALLQMDLGAMWPRYGFPNDLVARAAEADLRVAECGVDAIYGDEISGIRAWHALHPVGTVVLRAGLRRLRRQLMARNPVTSMKPEP